MSCPPSVRLDSDCEQPSAPNAELEQQHYLLMIETMVRAGMSGDEISGAIEAARAES